MSIIDIALGVLLAESVLYAVKYVVRRAQSRRTQAIVGKWLRNYVGN